MNLVIVESPTKARKLATYLGNKYHVEASVGHVRDLPAKELGVDIEHNFEPTYIVNPDKKAVIKKLTDLAKKADTVYLATDPDREGEAIAWHIKYLLSEGKGAKKDLPFFRATFHEITKQAVLSALDHPGEVNQALVDAQQARRVVDRLVGYQISPVLWSKVRRGLSAGRVQSVALRMIVEREREIAAFNPEEYWEVSVALSLAEGKVSGLVIDEKWAAELPANILISQVVGLDEGQYQPKQESDVTGVVAALRAASYQVKSVEAKQRRRSSLPPFTTSTLQQAAANRLGFTSKQTMRLAQQLYEEGLITYHRTDSFALSQSALDMAREYIGKEYGAQYLPEKPRVFSNSSKNAQEAHEAVRVTDARLRGDQITQTAKLTNSHVRLYDLIWRRFLASQMPEAIYDQTTLTIVAQLDPQLSGGPHTATLRTSGSVLTFDGWMRLFPAGDDTILPAVTPNQSLHYQELQALQKFTQPPPRYNDASLVKELEKRGIGRPSTYASIISVIEERGYVTRDQKRFTATSVGMAVSDFLVEHFSAIMDYDFTAEMEEDLDRIARGEKQWKKVVEVFYEPLGKIIASVKKNAERAQIPVEHTGEKCPLCGETEQGEIVIRSGRFGKFKSCSRFPACEFTENIVETLPDQTCPLCREGQIIVKKSRWGKQFFGCGRYPACNWASWAKPEPGLVVTTEEWAVMQAARAERKAARDAKYGKKDSSKAAPAKKKATKKKSTKKKSTAKRSSAKPKAETPI
jgi:DNA topoisomerase I